MKDKLKVGVLRSSKSIERLAPYSKLIFYMAKQYDIEIFLFSLDDINIEKKTINGIFLEKNKQVRKITSYPDVIDNMITWKRKGYSNAVDSIQEHSLLVRHPLNINKFKIHKMLLKDRKFANILIPTFIIKNFDDIEKYLKKFNNEIIIKPVFGSFGSGVLKLSKKAENYFLNINGKVMMFNNETIKKFYINNMSDTRRIIQPVIYSKTSQGNPFDIRIHARRGGNGNFVVHYYPRIGDSSGVISNIHAGGYTMNVDKFLKNEFGGQFDFVLNELKRIGNTFPDYFQRFYKNKIFAMGLDVGIQKNNDQSTFHLFEVNLRFPAGDFFEIKVAKTTLEYYWYLYENEKNNLLDRGLV